MPLVVPSLYQPPLLLRNGHFQTIFPSLFRRIKDISYLRKRISTPDDDFIDLDYSTVGAERIGIIAHGLEGDSHRSYVQGMVRVLNVNGWDAVVWNFRGCSGEPNRRLRSYHSGDTNDLNTVLKSVLQEDRYSLMAMIGFSMGGNVILKYLGERGRATPSILNSAVTFSVPCDLASAVDQMSRPANAVYMMRFLSSLHGKIRLKKKLFPGAIDDRGYHLLRTFKDFDERYTAPQHGFESAEDYWAKASSKPLLHHIKVPTLLVNALDDPFLSPQCYPVEEARKNSCFFLETPSFGGHVGFMGYGNGKGPYWSEIRAMRFLREHACSPASGF